jgi:hypothetical protein
MVVLHSFGINAPWSEEPLMLRPGAHIELSSVAPA